PHKHVEQAVDILASRAATHPDLELHVVGGGYWEAEIAKHAQERGVAERVHLHGFVDEPVKHELLARAWAVVMPSHKEGWGLTIVEAGLRSEEHTSELQSRENLVCRLLLDTATPDIYPLSLHDALPISSAAGTGRRRSPSTPRSAVSPSASTYTASSTSRSSTSCSPARGPSSCHRTRRDGA